MRHDRRYLVRCWVPRASSCACVLALAAAILPGCRKSGGTTGPSESNPTLSALELFPAELVVTVGEPVELRVIARDLGGADAPNVVAAYTSSNPAAVVVENGSPRSVGVGTATIRAEAGGRTAEAIAHVGAATYDLGAGAPRVLTSDYIDLSKIARVSRFRSTIGHSYTNGSGQETCRSMKHYFQPKVSVDWTTVDVFAPATGTIFLIRADGAFGFQLLLKPRDLAALTIVLFHVAPDSSIVRGSWVRAGDHIGRHSSSSTMSDIALSVGPEGTLLSYFEAIADAVFAKYQARGVSSRQAAIISRAERDADSVPCASESGGGAFFQTGTLENWVTLN